MKCLKSEYSICFYLHSNAILNIKMYSCISLGLTITQIKITRNVVDWRGGVHEAQKAWSLRFTLEVFIWRHVVYVPKSSTTFRVILICVIVRPRDMQEYILMFSIALENWCSWMTTFRNFKTYLPSALKHLSSCHFKILWKKWNIIVTFQSV
jgi:hypothetical protein